ncbi:MAG: hypothetical protein IKN91_04300 [Paludibacteraceae bacterium]|nr:hypothetical protein [Paludibacteraceae bacterium]
MLQYNVPILLITFNRPTHTRKVLEAILAQQPANLYVFRDGAREGNETDKVKCAEIEKVVDEAVKQLSPQTVLHTNYQAVNLGCGAGPATAFKWFFDNVEYGITMEDDCLPHPDFFPYCEELLLRYKEQPQLAFVNATLYKNVWQCGDASYGFSHYKVSGAWAAWRRTWENYDIDIKNINPWQLRRKVKQLTNNPAEADWWFFKCREVKADSNKHYWDYQMQMHLFMNDKISIHPCVNLISNIGFDAEGTHTMDNHDGRGDLPTFPIMPLKHPKGISINLKNDAESFAKILPSPNRNDKKIFIYKYLATQNRFSKAIIKLYKSLKGGK